MTTEPTNSELAEKLTRIAGPYMTIDADTIRLAATRLRSDPPVDEQGVGASSDDDRAVVNGAAEASPPCRASVPCAAYDPERWAREFGVDIAVAVSELPDRTSPDDWPEAMLVTASELSEIIEPRILPELETAFESGKEEGVDLFRFGPEYMARHHRVIMASVKLGAWMSAALDDPAVCDAMKADIHEWFSAGEPVVGWNASAIEAGTGETRSGSISEADESAVRSRRPDDTTVRARALEEAAVCADEREKRCAEYMDLDNRVEPRSYWEGRRNEARVIASAIRALAEGEG